MIYIFFYPFCKCTAQNSQKTTQKENVNNVVKCITCLLARKWEMYIFTRLSIQHGMEIIYFEWYFTAYNGIIEISAPFLHTHIYVSTTYTLYRYIHSYMYIIWYIHIEIFSGLNRKVRTHDTKAFEFAT